MALWSIIKGMFSLRKGLTNAVVSSYLRARSQGSSHSEALEYAIRFRFGGSQAIRGQVSESFALMVDSESEKEQLVTLVGVIEDLEIRRGHFAPEFLDEVRAAIDELNGTYGVVLT